ncbi:MAG: M20/M25/M40 family metallo-hydrolase [Candidatus Zixiibacteriota bacterium]|nr:MAG: M20/M25/M40 family metallo-hydrolase [candidate division Zixibacteria bacterium]
MKILITTTIFILCLTVTAVSDDLYQVTISSSTEAATLRGIQADILLALSDGYLVLADRGESDAILQSGLQAQLLATGVARDWLAIDARRDRKNAEVYDVVFEQDNLRILIVDHKHLAAAALPVEVFPLPDRDITIEYRAPSPAKLPDIPVSAADEIQLLIDQVDQDSLMSYVLALQGFGTRLCGTKGNESARYWIADKFAEFGYDSVVIDTFVGAQLWDRSPCPAYNVIAYRVGTVFPEQHIIIGGHFDAVPDCPGADDNASGTAAVLECARILKDVNPYQTTVFVAFDSEESGLRGAYHYVDGAVARDDGITLMINCDMIGHYENTDKADLYTGVESAYATLWDNLGNGYSGIDADLAGMVTSDHWPFQYAGYDVLMVQEKIFSTVYHTPYDNANHMNFEYMTRMVQATLATLHTVDMYPPPVMIYSVLEPGDGQSRIAVWQRMNPDGLSYYRLSYYPVSAPSEVTVIDLPPSDTSYTIGGLTEGQEYALTVQAYTALGQTSVVYDWVYFTPSSKPVAPFDVLALPVRDGVIVRWASENTELDFDRFAVVRDGEIIGQTLDTAFVDDDVSLGTDMHRYFVVAVDTEGNHSDTLAIEAVLARAATLEEGRILAVNRSHVYDYDFVDETETGVFMREALQDYSFVYRSDTAALNGGDDYARLELNHLIDYGLVVVGAETGLWDDLAASGLINGILDTLGYYLSIGGKAVIFGRWGSTGNLSELDYTETSSPYDDAYYEMFHIVRRFQTPTGWDYSGSEVTADMVGARTTIDTYPHMRWDSLATVRHSLSQRIAVTDVGGIPCVTYLELDTGVDVLYTYDSRYNDAAWEGRPVAWRYFGDDYSYVFFDMPLSFMERTSAIAALQQAVDELIAGSPEPGGEPVDPPDDLPGSFALSQNYPNPFNPGTEIDFDVPRPGHVKLEIFNIIGQRVIALVDRPMPAGSYSVSWDGAGVASGIYLYRLTAGDFVMSKKMMLIR